MCYYSISFTMIKYKNFFITMIFTYSLLITKTFSVFHNCHPLLRLHASVSVDYTKMLWKISYYIVVAFLMYYHEEKRADTFLKQNLKDLLI